jgi:subtilisin-like proprotein convertase family protein
MANFLPALKFTAASLLLLSTISCSSDAGDSDCTGDKCDVLVDFDSRLEGRSDPIADFLRTLDVDDQSRVEADFGTFAEGIAIAQGCGEESWKSFVISDAIVVGENFPRVVSTVCSDSPSKASEFFIAASFKDPNEEDVDVQRLEMFAWDAKTRQYRFYETVPVDENTIEITLDPQRCTGCHLTPNGLPNGGMHMTPIMNELTQPWSHWNSEVPMFSDTGIPFRNHDFVVPQEARAGDDLIRYAKDRVGAAQELEAIIRAGHDRVAGARNREKRGTTDDWTKPMNLLRPMFCEEQVNYTTEDFGTGLVRVSALIPGGLREAYRAERPDNWAWDWLNNDGERVRLPTAASVAPLGMLPVRGNADIAFEGRMMTPKLTAVLTPSQVLQIRALDWKRPVFSDFRCDLWKDALQRFETTPPRLAASTKVTDNMRELYSQIMVIDDVAIDSGDPVTFISLAVADEASVAALKADLQNDTLAISCGSDSESCRNDFNSFGDQLNDYVNSLVNGDPDTVRNQLKKQRDEDLCHIQKFVGAAPALPDFSCEEPETPDASFADTNNSAVDIVDNDTIESRIEVGGSAAIALDTVEVKVTIEHSWRGDLLLELVSNEGETREVHAFESGDSDDGFTETFSVAGFAASDDARGAWTLRVTDRATSDTGTLNSWSIGINTAAP